jgi:hypothetical protein
MIAEIRQVLLKMNQTVEGRAVLSAFEETTKFDDLPENCLQRIEESRAFIEQEMIEWKP